MRGSVGEVEDEEENDEELGVLTVGGVVLHKVFGLLCCDHIDVTHLHAHKHTLWFISMLIYTYIHSSRH